MLRHRKQWSTGFTFFKRKSTIKGRKRARGKTIAKNIKGYFYKSWKSFSLSLSWRETRNEKSIKCNPGGRFKKVIRKQRETTSEEKRNGKVAFPALSVDNSLLDPIHPFSNSNSEKFSTPVYTPLLPYPIPSQTNKRPVHGHETDLHSHPPIRVRALIRILETNRSPKGTARIYTVFV